MAFSNPSPSQRISQKTNVQNDPNDSPYKSVSSFKYFDDTVVSAYEVGIKNSIQKSTRVRNRSLPPKGRNTEIVESADAKQLNEKKKDLKAERDIIDKDISKKGNVSRNFVKSAHVKNLVPRNECKDLRKASDTDKNLKVIRKLPEPEINGTDAKKPINDNLEGIEAVDTHFDFLSKAEVEDKICRTSVDDGLRNFSTSLNIVNTDPRQINRERSRSETGLKTDKVTRYLSLHAYLASAGEVGTVSTNQQQFIVGSETKHATTSRRKLPKVPTQRSKLSNLKSADAKRMENKSSDDHINAEDISESADGNAVNKEDVIAHRHTLNNDEGVITKVGADVFTADVVFGIKSCDNSKSGDLSHHCDIIKPPDQFNNCIENVNTIVEVKTLFPPKITSTELNTSGVNGKEVIDIINDGNAQITRNMSNSKDSAEGVTEVVVSSFKGVVHRSSSSQNNEDVVVESSKYLTSKEGTSQGDCLIGDTNKRETSSIQSNEFTTSHDTADKDGCKTLAAPLFNQASKRIDDDGVEEVEINEVDKISSLTNNGACFGIEHALNDIVDRAADKLTKNVQANVFFSFDKTIIQELTDSVMVRDCASCENEKEAVKTNSLNKTSEKSAIHFEEKNEGDKLTSNDRKSEYGVRIEIKQETEVSNRENVDIEGKSIDGKDVMKNTNTDCKTILKSCDAEGEINKDDKCKSGHGGEVIDSHNGLTGTTKVIDNKTPESNTLKQVNVTGQKKVKVERTPSYRRRVMARAKNRYSKKSKNLKDCSCVRKENGDIEVCQFCLNYSARSQTSLGNVTLNKSGGTELSDSEYSEISSPRRAFTPGLPPLPGQSPISGDFGSPKSLRKVQVSSRVDVLLNSDLFKKHLKKHENSIHNHTMTYKKFGLKKSVSNLDLSEGYVLDSDQSQADNESEAGDTHFDTDDTNDGLSSNRQEFSLLHQKPRRYSLTGDSDSSIEAFQRSRDRKKKHTFGTLPKSQPRSRPQIPSFTDIRSSTQSHYPIPSFTEFRKNKEKQSMLYKDVSEDKIATANENTKLKNTETDHERFKEDRSSPLPKLDLHTIREMDSKGSKEDLIMNSMQNIELFDSNTPNAAGSELISHVTNDLHLRHTKGSDTKDITKTPQKNKPLVKQNSASDIKEKQQQRVRPKLKSRTLSRLNLDTDYHCSSAGEISDTGGNSPRNSLNEKHRTGAKRPRSVFSKKSSLVDSNIGKDGSNESLNLHENIQSARPKLKIGSSVNRSKSDSKYETEKVKNSIELVEAIPTGSHSRDLSPLGRRNCLSLDIDEVSQCSTQDVGESETSTSLAGSTLSDSLRSEVNIDDSGQLLYDPDDSDSELADRFNLLKEDSMALVLRSTSDACEITQEAARKRRERKERPYKSDPFSGTEIIPASKRYLLREERARLRQQGSSKQEVLTFLDGVSHGDLMNGESFPSLEELNEDDEQETTSENVNNCHFRSTTPKPSKNLFISDVTSETARKLRKNLSNVSSVSTDSGVIGQEGSHDSHHSSPSNTLCHSVSTNHVSSWKHLNKKRSLSASCSDLYSTQLQENCVDCGHSDKYDSIRLMQICPQCYRRRIERKKTIQEIVDTEMNYGRDLSILKDEFYTPMMKAGLLNQEQLDSIFLNLDELIHVHKHFISKIKTAINSANHSNDDDMQNVMIGSLFLESSTMFLTFENYCVNQAQAPVLLEQLEKDKQLLRIFLHVSQSENHLLRRMHLKSFLMVPVQRIMKYPLLLDRLYKATPIHHNDKDSIKEAKEKIEDILGHINTRSKTTMVVKQRKLSEKHYSVTEKMEVSRVALETLHWNRKDVCDVITSRLQITQPLDHMWAAKKCKNYKFQNVHGVLLSLVQPSNDNVDGNNVQNNIISNTNNSTNNNNNNIHVQHAAVVFIKEKNNKYQVIREPFMLEKCVVSQDPDFMDVFEILEWNKESYLIKAESTEETKSWVQNLRRQMHNLGCWRKRRNALPNILLNHLA